MSTRKTMTKRKIMTPAPNLAARALRERQFQAKVVKNPRIYSRKIKHKKGSSHLGAPLFLAWNAARDNVHPN